MNQLRSFHEHIAMRLRTNARKTHRDVSFCACSILHPTEVLVVPDALLDPRFRDNALIEEIGLRFYAGAPLVNDVGAALGPLCVIDHAQSR